MSCSTLSSLASSTRPSVYFTVQITCPPVLKTPNPSKAFLIPYSLHQLNRIGDKQYPCLTALRIIQHKPTKCTFSKLIIEFVILMSSTCFEPDSSPSGKWFICGYGMACFTSSLVHRTVCSINTHS